MKKLLFAAGTFVIALACIAATPRASKTQMTPDQKLRYAEAIISGYYVDSVNEDTLVSEAIISMLKTLDPHSAYSSPEETKELNQPLEGKFSGIGVQFTIVKDTVCVVQATPGGPSEKVGIRPGDRIVYVNDTIFTHPKMQNSEVLKTLRGPKGTVVNLKVKRAGVADLIDFRLIRDDIPIYSVDASYMVAPEVGFISITRFAEDTPDELDKAIDKLASKGMKHLILDLASNGGGYLGAAHGVASRFLKEGDLVVYTDGLNSPTSKFYVEDNDFGSLFGNNKKSTKRHSIDRLVIMVDQYSASASEIVAGAIQDNDRGLISGRRTFGKGLVQRPFPFPDGSMMRLTTARYYTPSGRCIQKEYHRGQGEEYQLDLLNRYKSGELWHADSIHFNPDLKVYTLKNHRPVYGGGGIMPDQFVPVDTSYYSPYYRDLIAKASINTYVTTYIDQNRKKMLKQYPNEDVFYEKFIVDDQIMDGLVKQGQQDSVKLDSAQLATSRPMLEAIIKGLLARDLYTDGNYVRSVNPLNPDFKAALDLILDPKRYNDLLTSRRDPAVKE